MGGASSVAQSDLGGDAFKPASAAKMAFCTAGWERFPRWPPCSKTVSWSAATVVLSQAKTTVAADQLTVFEQGGHLGNLSHPAVQKAILAALAGLKASPPKSD